MGRNSQKHPRIGPLLIRTVFSIGERNGQGYVTNLSLGGAFLATDEKVPDDQPLRLVIFLPWQLGQVDVEAKVVWRSPGAGSPGARPPGMGIQFSELDSAAKEKIEAYLKRFHQFAASLTSTVS